MKPQLPDGTKVKFHHTRLCENDIPFLFTPRGGQTECIVTFPDGTEDRGQARCSKRDNYSKRIGRDIALGRALKAVKENT